MRKVVVIMCVFVMILPILFSAGQREASTDTFRLRFSSAGVPGDAHTQAMFVFKETVEELSGGRITVEVHHSSSLFSQENEIDALLTGSLEMSYTSPFWFSEFVPHLSMFTAGYMFSGYEHMTSVYNGEIGRQIAKDVSDTLNMVPLGAFYLGSRQLNLRDIGRDVKTPDDLRGVSLRMPNSPAWLFLGRALGANPTPVSFGEIYMALSTGTVDGQDNPLPTVFNAKFYEVTNQISLTYHVVDSVWPVINKDVWNRMGPELQEIMYQAIDVAREACDSRNLTREAELVEYFESKGLRIVHPDIPKFMERVQSTYLNDKQMTATWDMDLFAKVQSMAQ